MKKEFFESNSKPDEKETQEEIVKRTKYNGYKNGIWKWHSNNANVKKCEEEKDLIQKRIVEKKSALRTGYQKEEHIKTCIADQEQEISTVKAHGEGKNFSQNLFTINDNLLTRARQDFAQGYMTKRQTDYLSKTSMEVSKTEDITSVGKLRNLNEMFISSDLAEYIRNLNVDMNLVERMGNKRAGIVGIVSFILVFIMFKLSSSAMGTIADLVVLGIMAVTMAGIGYGIFLLTHDVIGWNVLWAGLTAGFSGLFGGGMITVFLSEVIGQLFTSGNIFIVLIISIVFAIAIFLLTKKIVNSDRMKMKRANNKSIIDQSRKMLYVQMDNKSLGNRAIEVYLYCLIHYEEMLSYINTSLLQSYITRQDEELLKSKKEYEGIKEFCKELENEIAGLEKAKAMQQTKIEECKEENQRLYQEVLRWNERPELDWFEDYTIEPSISLVCRNNDIFTMTHEGKKPIIFRDSFDSNDRIFDCMKDVIDAFQKMNPKELLEVSVIDLAPDAQFLTNRQGIDWTYSITDIDGIEKKHGSVTLVSNQKDLKEYCDLLQGEADHQMSFFHTHMNDSVMNDILMNSSEKSIRELNHYMKEKENAPFKYHVMLIFPDYINRNDCDTLVRVISGGIYCGFIPVLMKKKDTELLDNWNVITQKAIVY